MVDLNKLIETKFSFPVFFSDIV